MSRSSGGAGVESLISGGEGHGEQPLLNLLLTGTPSAHVFDGTRDVDGLSEYFAWRRGRDLSRLMRV